MNLDHTRPLPSATRHLYRCTCGTDVEIDRKKGGVCQSCGRNIPAAVTRFPLSMTMTIAEMGQADQGPAADPDMPAGGDDLVGKQLGHFEILELIGRGGMGQVYRALDTSLQRYVAVKVIRGSGFQELDPVGQQRLMREAIAQARVNHPNIVTIFYVGRENDIPFLAMELVDGCSIAELISQGEIPYETLCHTAIRITHALDTASQMGIVHSDIKPHNLLVLSNGEVKLSDFGMARIGDGGPDESYGGTPNYLAPELLDSHSPTPQSDMYALGVTLYEMTFGRLPVNLSGSTPQEWAAIHHDAEIPFPDNWPEHLPLGWQTILSRLLARHPDDRYSGFRELGGELNKILPTPRPDAPRLSRVIGWLIDVATVAICTVPLVLVVVLVGMTAWVPRLPAVTGAVFLVAILAGFALIESWWRQSPGRELLHTKVVNRYGLTPSRRAMMIRSVLRMMPVWGLAAGWLLGTWVSFVWTTVILFGLVWLLLDGLYMIFRSGGSSLHDRIAHTRVVVGSDSN